MEYGDLFSLERQPSKQLCELLKTNSIPNNQRVHLLQIIRKRRRIRRKYPRKKLRKLPTQQLDTILQGALQEENITLVSPVIQDILHILHTREGV